MAKMLLSQNEELISLVLYYQVKNNKYGIRQYKILEEDEAKSLISKGDKEIDILSTKWSLPTWRSNSNIVRSSTFYNPSDGTNRLDWSRYEDNVFKTCLKEWDVVDENNQPVPVNQDTIGYLPVPIASALLQKYNKCLSLDEDEKKNNI